MPSREMSLGQISIKKSETSLGLLSQLSTLREEWSLKIATYQRLLTIIADVL